MRMVCNHCGEPLETDDVVIEGGHIECPKCKAGMLLDDLLKGSPALDYAAWNDKGELIPPVWLKVSEADGVLTLRWRWNHAGLCKRRYLLYSVLATGCVAVIALAAAVNGGPFVVLGGLMLVVGAGFVFTLLLLTQLVNSTIVQFDGHELLIWHGPLFGPGRRRATRLPAGQISALRFRRSGQPPHFDYSLAYRTMDGRRWQLNCSLRDGAAARFVKQRLDDALGLNL